MIVENMPERLYIPQGFLFLSCPLAVGLVVSMRIDRISGDAICQMKKQFI